MLHAAGPADGDAARDEHEADRESLGDVVDRDRERDHETEGLAASERHAHRDALAERVGRHEADDEQHPSRVRPRDRAEVGLRHASEDSAGDRDGEDTEDGSRDSSNSSVRPPLPEQTDAGSDHEPGGEGVGETDRGTAGIPPQEERERAEAGCNRSDRGHD